ncbi:hypothetical protein Cob_v006547 [Colletotrichum orbiculare MAFF 240422]|uniref:Uncharacterized protein n=1 Tax=Colletotrichum orbiculare (strain 104-T / ATCC 96160 / CBS 514.97 / LARS 414 / MAFF 240422) TaxID=1213857 RepID=A0A484FSG2_COLOR|nr:hypothetical protein Cob_v006547 [Colletotrichum orbiculare MAFF 240422]
MCFAACALKSEGMIARSSHSEKILRVGDSFRYYRSDIDSTKFLPRRRRATQSLRKLAAETGATSEA